MDGKQISINMMVGERSRPVSSEDPGYLHHWGPKVIPSSFGKRNSPGGVCVKISRSGNQSLLLLCPDLRCSAFDVSLMFRSFTYGVYSFNLSTVNEVTDWSVDCKCQVRKAA